MVELASATRVATAELKKAIAAFSTRLSKRVSSAAGQVKSKKNKDKDSLPLIFELGLEKGSQISSLTRTQLHEILTKSDQAKDFAATGNWSSPLLIKVEDEQQQTFQSETMKAALQTFQHAFASKAQQDGPEQGRFGTTFLCFKVFIFILLPSANAPPIASVCK